MSVALTPRVVTADDDGIRPAGPPDACFYCRRKVGERHAFDCVTVTVPRVYRVVLDGEDIGSWATEDPASWDRDMREFHKNESSWCVGNIVDDGLRLDEGRSLPADDEQCLCNSVTLEPADGEPEYVCAPDA